MYSRNQRRRALHIGQANDIQSSCATRNTTTSTVAEDRQKIDRILFNLYADMASGYRCATAPSAEENDDGQSEQPSEEMAILKCLEGFVAAQPGRLIDVVIEYLARKPKPSHGSPSTTNFGRSPGNMTGHSGPSPDRIASAHAAVPFVPPPSAFADRGAPARGRVSESITSLSDLSLCSLRRRLGDPFDEDQDEVVPAAPRAHGDYFINDDQNQYQQACFPDRSPASDIFFLGQPNESAGHQASNQTVCPRPIKDESFSPLPLIGPMFDGDLWNSSAQLPNSAIPFGVVDTMGPPLVYSGSSHSALDFHMSQRNFDINAVMQMSEGPNGTDDRGQHHRNFSAGLEETSRTNWNRGRLSLTPMQEHRVFHHSSAGASLPSRHIGKPADYAVELLFSSMRFPIPLLASESSAPGLPSQRSEASRRMLNIKRPKLNYQKSKLLNNRIVGSPLPPPSKWKKSFFDTCRPAGSAAGALHSAGASNGASVTQRRPASVAQQSIAPPPSSAARCPSASSSGVEKHPTPTASAAGVRTSNASPSRATPTAAQMQLTAMATSSPSESVISASPRTQTPTIRSARLPRASKPIVAEPQDNLDIIPAPKEFL